jgi:hypothetical protein
MKFEVAELRLIKTINVMAAIDFQFTVCCYDLTVSV